MQFVNLDTRAGIARLDHGSPEISIVMQNIVVSRRGEWGLVDGLYFPHQSYEYNIRQIPMLVRFQDHEAVSVGDTIEPLMEILGIPYMFDMTLVESIGIFVEDWHQTLSQLFLFSLKPLPDAIVYIQESPVHEQYRELVFKCFGYKV